MTKYRALSKYRAWTAAELEAIEKWAAAPREGREPMHMLAAAVNRTGAAVAQKIKMLSEKPCGKEYISKPAQIQKRSSRTCLRCRKKFLSEGKHNQICGVCKDSTDWRQISWVAV